MIVNVECLPERYSSALLHTYQTVNTANTQAEVIVSVLVCVEQPSGVGECYCA